MPQLWLLGSAILTITTLGHNAWAGPALDDGKPASLADQPVVTEAEVPVEYGVGIRLRDVMIPKGELELFLGRAAGGSNNIGIGIDLTRRRGNVELQLGFEYEHISPGEGVWIEKDKNVPTDDADYLLGPNHAPESLGWVTFEFTFINHTPLTKNLSFRYGGGAGIGIITGGLYRNDIHCASTATNANPEPGCVPTQFGGTGTYTDTSGAPNGNDPTPHKYGLPPVFPVVNAIIGLQFKPTDKMTINLEGGIRTLLFFGLSASYFF
jgi:hypothetical protein